MLNFPGKTLNFLKRYLLRQKREVDKNIREVEEDDPVSTPSLAESSEPGTDSYIADIHTKTVVLKNQLIKTKSSIKVALGKMKNGKYGKCEKCGRQIEIGRLLAMPIAKYCLSCSRKVREV